MEQFEQIGSGIYLLKVPFGPVWTGVVLVQGEENYLIDSSATAEDVDRYVIPALEEMGIRPGDIQWLLNTHSHGDHIGGHHRFCQVYSPKVAAFENAAPKVENPVPYAIATRTRFPEHSPAPQCYMKGVKVDKILADGDMLGNRLQVIHTPGHDDDCVCWYDRETKTLITGDSLQANGTICQGVGFYKDLVGYRAALLRLLGMDVEAILCGHDYDGIGWLIQGKFQAKAALNKCLAYLEQYHSFLAKRYRAGERDQAKLALELIDTLGCGRPERLFMALYTVEQHIMRLEKE